MPAYRQLLALVAAVALTTAPALALAERPPQDYRDQQAQAPEFLQIKVTGVKTTETDTPRATDVAVVVEATVEKVERSASGVKPGAKIEIRYTHIRHKARGFVGASEVPILAKDDTGPAYLTAAKDGKTFGPAAGGFSFRTMPAAK